MKTLLLISILISLMSCGQPHASSLQQVDTSAAKPAEKDKSRVLAENQIKMAGLLNTHLTALLDSYKSYRGDPFFDQRIKELEELIAGDASAELIDEMMDYLKEQELVEIGAVGIQLFVGVDTQLVHAYGQTTTIPFDSGAAVFIPWADDDAHPYKAMEFLYPQAAWIYAPGVTLMFGVGKKNQPDRFGLRIFLIMDPTKKKDNKQVMAQNYSQKSLVEMVDGHYFGLKVRANYMNMRIEVMAKASKDPQTTLGVTLDSDPRVIVIELLKSRKTMDQLLPGGGPQWKKISVVQDYKPWAGTWLERVISAPWLDDFKGSLGYALGFSENPAEK